MKIKRVNELMSDKVKNQENLEDFLFMLEKEFDIESLDNFASSFIKYEMGKIRMRLIFVVMVENELNKILEIKEYIAEKCDLKSFVIRPADYNSIECYFLINHDLKYKKLYDELKMKKDAKKYNL